MMKPKTFAAAAYAGKRKQLSKEEFLFEMDPVAP